jgi:saccharopine dehydrogenase (NAD+, L-lysine forming)
LTGCEVVVVGAKSAQAQAMMGAAAKAEAIEGWIALDHSWDEGEKLACERLGVQTVEVNPAVEPNRLRELALDTALVANFATPSHETGPAVLDACIDVGCDYLDACDDANATIAMLERDEAARAAGIRALIGMGCSPGITNVLVRAARDWLGAADEVSLSWTVDVRDVTDATLRRFWEIVSPVEPDDVHGSVLAWEDLELRTVEFPDPLGEQLVIGVTQSEPVTLPRFLGIETVRNFGGVVPADSLVVGWALARLGAADGENARVALNGSEVPVSALASQLYQRYLETRAPTAHLGGGLVVDVWSGEEGVRFASAGQTSPEESTAIGAAAGIKLMLEAGPEDSGVIAPECLDPVEFFPRLGRFSHGTGALGAYRMWGSEEGVRISIRDLLSTRIH